MNKKRIIIITIELAILIGLYFFVNSKYISVIPKCWIHSTTGLLCPSCGGTRCIINIFNGNLIQAFKSHAIFFMGIVYLLIVNIIYLINLNKSKKILTWIYPKYWYAIIFSITLVIYTIIINLLYKSI